MRYRGFFMLRLQRKTKTRFQSAKPLAPGTRLSPRYLMVCPKIEGSLMTKKIYLDENGNPCKNKQTPEYKAKANTRHQTPEYKAKAKARHQTPEYKAKAKARLEVYRKTPEYKAINKAYRQTLKYKAIDKARIKAYRQTPKGRAKYRAHSALRHAIKLQRSMLLTEAGKKVIAEIHKNCPDDWHVDHIVPLQGETVSGLHVPENLQYLPKSINTMKYNRWDNSWASHTMDTPLEEKIKAYTQT